MNPKRISIFRDSLTVTTLALLGVLGLSASCVNSNGSKDDNATGGAGGTGGSSAGGTGGAGGGGGSGDYCNQDPPTDTVGFCKGSGKGVMLGDGFVALGLKDFITDPKCDGKEITKTEPCNSKATWNADGKVCISGTVPALPSTPGPQDYKDNWGVEVGVHASQATDGTLNQDYKNVIFNVSGKPSTGLRFLVHLLGDDTDTTYCVNSKSGQKSSLDGFNTKCWGEAGTVNLTFDKVKNIDQVGVEVAAGNSEIKVEDLCLESVVFGK
jgi:hypothetical protein